MSIFKKYFESVVPAVCVDTNQDSVMFVQAGGVQDTSAVDTREYLGLSGVQHAGVVGLEFSMGSLQTMMV